MEVTSSTITVGMFALPATTMQKPIEPPSETKILGYSTPRAVDFSNITPRQLQAYLDDRLMSGQIDGPDGLYCTTLFGAIPGEWYAERPDVPMDFTATISSMAGFARDNGFSKLVSLYDGLMDWMKMMETQPARISVIA
ncbi:hypothetical protein C8J98_10110 [Luteibacter sp. OK325]|uniref:hypothetical protein n=1 Tax=Luteibacter sp. OK325 TaxID=2135670 RepID=UPI000D3D9E2C|nr:hypothetical protein [Luteibacter sp. OK325]PTR34754.1 hypothetical protein C8J98_10110 [Luteibacter sp. OK325]